MNEEKLIGALDILGDKVDQLSDRLDNLSTEVSRISAHISTQSPPLDNFVAKNHLHFSRHHYASHYERWRIVRINKILEIYGVDFFKGKKIVELGAGHGDIGAFFCELGAEVLCLEGRQENANIAKIKYRNLENFTFKVCDLETMDFSTYGRFDLVINFGFLYTLTNPEACLKTCALMSDDIVCECIVSDSVDPHAIIAWEEPTEDHTAGLDHGLRNGRQIMSPYNIERVMASSGFAFTRYFSKDLNSPPHTYDWEHQNTGEVVPNYRRFWHFHKT